MSEIALIAALDLNRAIGRDGSMAWHLPDDLRRFKKLTLGQTVLMGRKTYDSIGKPLPGRDNLVLSRDPTWSRPGVQRVANLSEASMLSRSLILWVIGGGEIYQLALPYAQRMELTEVDTQIASADAWFPDFDRALWELGACESRPADEKHAYARRDLSYIRR